MKMISMLVPETLVGYVEVQKAWVEKKQTGALEMNFFQGGVTNMNLKNSLKLSVSPPGVAQVRLVVYE